MAELGRNSKKSRGRIQIPACAGEQRVPQHASDVRPRQRKEQILRPFEIAKAEEFSVLKEEFGNYLNMINLFGARHEPRRVLEAGRFPKMFFEQRSRFPPSASMPPCPGRGREAEHARFPNRQPAPGRSNSVGSVEQSRFREFVDSKDPMSIFQIRAVQERGQTDSVWRSEDHSLDESITDYDSIGKSSTVMLPIAQLLKRN